MTTPDLVEVPSRDFQVMLLCWFRYSLGRQTYMPSYCCEYLKKHWDILPYDYKRQIHDDINNAIEHDMAGHACDVSTWKVENNRWQARIRIVGKQHHIGLFDTEEDAAYAYNQAAKLQHGDFSRLNILPDSYVPPVGSGECPLCHQTPIVPVSISLEECAEALRQIAINNPSLYCILGCDKETTEHTIKWLARAVLGAAGVKYVE